MKQQTYNIIGSKKQRNLLIAMVRMDFKLRYKESALGYLWSILRPLMLFGIYYTVFTKFLKFGADVPNYAFSLLIGIVLWSFFAEATSGALKSVVGKGSLIRKIYIPRFLIPITTISSSLINLALNSLVVVFFIVVFADNLSVSWLTLLVVPLVILELVVFTTAVGFFLAALYVKFRDIGHIWDVVKQALFYGTPIIYPLTRIPNETVQKILMANPLGQLIQDVRYVTTNDQVLRVSDVYGTPIAYAIPLGVVALSAVIGLYFFNSKSDTFAENV